MGAFFSDGPGPDPTCLSWDDVALVADTAQLYVVQWSRLCTGADVVALRLDTGAWCWGRAARGLGEVVHSRYWNAVGAELVDGVHAAVHRAPYRGAHQTMKWE